MKKTIAVVLVLCMLSAVLPAFAESAGETAPKGPGLGELLGGLLSEAEKKIKESEAGSKLFELLDEAEKKIKESDAGSKLSGLLDELKKNVGEKASELMPKLKELMSKALKDPTGKFAALLSKIKEKLGSGDSAGLESLLGGLLGGNAPAESAPEDEEDLAETIERLNREAEADTGENVPDRKQAESVEEFYGHWKETKYVFNNEEIDAGDFGEGAYIAENTYYITMNGEKSPDYLYPETAELTIRDGVLKINSDGHWTTYVMTNSGEIVLSGSSLLCYFSRVDQ